MTFISTKICVVASFISAVSVLVCTGVFAAEINGPVFGDEHYGENIQRTLQGTEPAPNDVSLGVIPGADFAYAVFSIRSGNTPIDPSFRDTILGI